MVRLQRWICWDGTYRPLTFYREVKKSAVEAGKKRKSKERSGILRNQRVIFLVSRGYWSSTLNKVTQPKKETYAPSVAQEAQLSFALDVLGLVLLVYANLVFFFFVAETTEVRYSAKGSEVLFLEKRVRKTSKLFLFLVGFFFVCRKFDKEVGT